jgi:hypothetical protein
LTKIQKQLRTLLTEKKGVTYDYGCVMLKFNIGQLVWGDIQDRIEDSELCNVGDANGRENDPHITLLYGLHSEVKLSDVVNTCKKFEPVTVTFDKVDYFENDGFDVIKFNVSSEQLSSYNELLKKLPHTNSYPEYKPHLTIAYVEKGLGKEICERFRDIAFSIESKTIEYSMADGGTEIISIPK